MPTGHVAFDNFWFPLVNRQWSRVLADPMAARTAQGAPEYTDNTVWDYFIQDAWSAGAGAEVSDGTNLMTTSMSAWSQTSGLGFMEVGLKAPAVLFMNNLNEWSVTVGGDSSVMKEFCIAANEKDATQVGSDGSTKVVSCEFWVLGDGKSHVVDLKVYAGALGPDLTFIRTGSAVASKHVLIRPDIGVQKVSVSFFNADNSDIHTADYSVVSVQPRDEIRVLFGDSPHGDLVAALPPAGDASVSGDWVSFPSESSGGLKIMARATRNYSIHVKTSGHYPHKVRHVKEYSQYSGYIGLTLYDRKYWVVTDTSWFVVPDKLTYDGQAAGSTTVSTLPATLLDYSGDGETIYGAFGDANYVQKMTTVFAGPANTNYYADLIEVGGGYLWRITGSTLLYTADPSANPIVWETISLGDAGLSPLALKYFSGAPYWITSRGLFYLAPGDVPVRLATFDREYDEFWGSAVWGQRLYWSADGQVYEFDGSTIRPIFPATNWGLRNIFGDLQVRTMYAGNEFLDMVAVSELTQGYPDAEQDLIVLRYDGSQVHMIDVIYGGFSGGCALTHEYIVSDSVWEIRSPDKKTAWDWSRDEVRGYLGAWRSGWITGGMTDVDKDWESVKLISHQMSDAGSAGTYAVWYQSDDSDEWSYLGSAYINEEVRWPVGERPASKKIRLGFVVAVNGTYDTDEIPRGLAQPRISALRVKHHAMVEDRWRWDLAVPAKSNMLMLDGLVRDESVYEIEEILGDKIRRSQPFMFIDVDGSEYEVKVTSAAVSLDALGRSAQGDNEYGLVYRLSLEEMDPKEQRSRSVTKMAVSDLLDDGVPWSDGVAWGS